MRIAIVTGASSGMGREFVYEIARKYKTIEEIWVIARREDRLASLAMDITNKKIKILPMDLTEAASIEKYCSLLAAEKPEVRILVNASGFGKIGHFDAMSIEDNAGMVALNCDTLVKITHATIPYMTKPSNIIQMASSAAFLPQPSFSIYAATKSFVLSFSRSLNVELADKGITVTAVCPGPVKTEFFNIAQTNESIKIYKMLIMGKADKVVKKAMIDAKNGKDISVYGITMHAFQFLTKFVPHGCIIPFIK